MPLVTIWRKPKEIDDEKVIKIRDMVEEIVRECLKVEMRQVEVRVRDISPLDIYAKKIGIEIDTGPGKDRWRANQCVELAKQIADKFDKRQFNRDILSELDLGPGGPYIWLRVFEASCFVPIACPNDAR